MSCAPTGDGSTLPPNEAERLNALRAYEVLDTEAEQDFDDITLLASQVGGTPIALSSVAMAGRCETTTSQVPWVIT